jgi:hypothetical protein
MDGNTTARKPGPLYFIQYYQFYQPNFLVGSVTKGKGCFFRYAGFMNAAVPNTKLFLQVMRNKLFYLAA